MIIREIEAGSGVFGISPAGDGVKIEYYRGKDVSASVPENIEGKPVTGIGKKAFLGIKTLLRISLPDTVESIGDWAFASCSALEEIELPQRKITFGNGLFKDCDKLLRVKVRKSGGNKEEAFLDKEEVGMSLSDSMEDDLAYLLALAVSKLDAGYLLDTERAGSPEWTGSLDGLLRTMLGRDDSEGFSKMLLCGEEDYVGDESNLDTYILLRKREKVRALLIRFLHDGGLSENDREVFGEYLKQNMQAVVWPLVLEEHGSEQEYFDLLINIGCISEENISRLIDSMGDRYTQMKGYLIRFKGESKGSGDPFGELEL